MGCWRPDAEVDGGVGARPGGGVPTPRRGWPRIRWPPAPARGGAPRAAGRGAFETGPDVPAPVGGATAGAAAAAAAPEACGACAVAVALAAAVAGAPSGAPAPARAARRAPVTSPGRSAPRDALQ